MTSLSVGFDPQVLSNLSMGECMTLIVKKVKKRSKKENMAVFISQRNSKGALLVEDLFEVVSLT
jgi:hypothetical protein